MNELVITPNFEKKSAKIRGRCAAGEHVLVRLVGMAGLPAETLRLCVMLRERLFAVFPLAIEDSAAEWSVDGGDLTCVLNLNTEPLVKFARCGALTLEFILDDPSNHILYFSEMHQVQPWHSLRASGDDAQPRDTPPFDGVVISTKSLGDLREAVRRLAEKGGAKVIGAVAVALLAVRGAFAATVQTVPLNDLDYDVNPPIVTSVTFEGLADATNVYTKAETEAKIVELAPAPGNYAAVSNAAMSAKTNLSAIFNMDNPTAVPKAVEAQESESASFATEANKAYNLFAEGEEPESRSSIDIFVAIDAALRKDKQNSDVQIFGGFLSGFGFHADTGHNDNGWNQYTAHNGTALSQSLPAYILSNPWGFLKQGEAIPTTGGVFNAYIHLNQKFSVGTWTQYVKPIESVGGSGIAFAFGDNVQTRAANTMVLGVGALNTNNWSFIWNGDANRIYIPTQPNISNPYSTRHNGGFHVNPSIRSGMTNPLQNFWIGDMDLATWISTLAPAPGNYASVSNAAMNALSRNEAEAGYTEWRPYEEPGYPAGYSVVSVTYDINQGWTVIVLFDGEENPTTYSRSSDPEDAVQITFDGNYNSIVRTKLRPTKASEVGAYSTGEVDTILQGYLPLDYFRDGQTIPMYWGDGTKLCDFGANWLGSLAAGVQNNSDAIDAISDDIPPAVSNIVTTALVRERLGVYLYVGADGGIYVHTNED